MYLFKGKVEKKWQLTSDIFCLRIGAPEKFCQTASPGKFVMLGRDDNLVDPLLKRPFGICDWGPGWFEVSIKILGKGSAQLCTLNIGDGVSVNGPLGNGYPEFDSSPLLLVAGGMGIASIVSCLLPASQNKKVGSSGEKVLLFGAATEKELIFIDKIRKLDSGLRIETITDDGSSGEKGFVTELLDVELQRKPNATTFACGPEPMLKSVQSVLKKYQVSGYLSLENRMACGFGVCLGCVQSVVSDSSDDGTVKSAKVCTQGPVFPAERVVF